MCGPQGLHETVDADVQFAVAAYVCPYTRYVASVWVYVATIVPKLPSRM